MLQQIKDCSSRKVNAPQKEEMSRRRNANSTGKTFDACELEDLLGTRGSEDGQSWYWMLQICRQASIAAVVQFAFAQDTR